MNAILTLKERQKATERFIRRDLQEFSKQMNLLRCQSDLKNQEISSHEQKIIDMKRENKQMRVQYDLERDRTRALVDTNAALRAELGRFTHVATQMAEINEENARLIESINALKIKNAQYENRIDDLEEANRNYINKYERVKTEFDRKVSYLQTRVKSVPDIVDTSQYEKTILGLKEENKALMTELQKKISIIKRLELRDDHPRVKPDHLDKSRSEDLSLSERFERETQTDDPNLFEKKTETDVRIDILDCDSHETGQNIQKEIITSSCETIHGKHRQFNDLFVLPPTKLKIEREFNDGLLISWTPPPALTEDGQVYEIYLNDEKRAIIPVQNKPRHLLDNINLEEVNSRSLQLSRISVVSKVGPLVRSEMYQCSILVGKGSSSTPTHVTVENITGYSVTVSWRPGNSNCHHIVYVNDADVAFLRPGVQRACISHLNPLNEYKLRVTAVFVDSQRKQKITTDSETITFRTDKPCNFDVPTSVMLEPGPQCDTLLVSWRPSAKKDPILGPKGYAVFFDGILVRQVFGAKSDHVILPAGCLQKGLVRKMTIRSFGYDGTESADSTPFEITKNFICDVFQLPEEPKPELKPSPLLKNPEIRKVDHKPTDFDEMPEIPAKLEIDEEIVNNAKIRYFLALYTYNPFTMSPNKDSADEEIAFTKDDIIKVYGEIDADGFYQGECRGRFGYVPSNVVKEITNTERLYELSPKQKRSCKTDYYVAIFDFDPISSINLAMDIGKQMRLKRGQTVYVKGPINSDGFCLAESKNEEGYVPINYLRRASNSADLNFYEERMTTM